MLISFIIPVYNAESRIENTVNSVLALGNVDMEIILINDGSTDDTDKICNILSKQNDCVRVLHQKNKGPAAARNAGIQIANGEYISFIDADDKIDTKWSGILPNLLKKKTADIYIFGYCAIKFRKNNNFRSVRIIPQRDFYQENPYSKGEWIVSLYKQNLLNPIWNKVYRTNLIRNRKIEFREEFKLGEDLLFNLEILTNTDQIEVIKKPLYNYIFNANSLTQSYTADKFSKLKPVTIEFRKYLKKLEISDQVYYIRLLQNIYNSLLELSNKNCDLTYSKKIEEIIKIQNDSDVIELLEKYEPKGAYRQFLVKVLFVKNPHVLYRIGSIFNRIKGVK